MDHTEHAESNWFCNKEFHQQEDFEALILTRFCFRTTMEFSPLSNGPTNTATCITYFFSHQGQDRVHVYLDTVSLEFPFLPFCRRSKVLFFCFFFFLKKCGRSKSKLLVRSPRCTPVDKVKSFFFNEKNYQGLPALPILRNILIIKHIYYL